MTTSGEQSRGVHFQHLECLDVDLDAYYAAIEAADQAVRDGGCIVFPTDTVYGIAADAFNHLAVKRLLDAKHVGREFPPAVLISGPDLIRALAADVPDEALNLIQKHWPGPLTVVCRMQPSLRMDLGNAPGIIALRVPNHDLARNILRKTGPMAVSSANLRNQAAAMTCQQAIDQLGDSVAVYLDAGPLGGADAAPSTIVDFTQYAGGEILRHGALSIEVIRETLPDVVDLADPTSGDQDADGGSGAGSLQQDPDSSAEPADDETGAGG